MKILCTPYTHTLSHISRPLAVALELAKRGHEVIFAGESPKTRFIEQEGFTVLPLHEPDPEELYGNIRQGKLRFISNAEVERMVAADLALYHDVNPDIVFTDGRFSAPISTHIHGLKQCAIVNVSSTEFRALPYIPFFDWVPQCLRKDCTIGKKLDRCNLTLEMFIFDSVMGIFKELSNKYGLKKRVTATNCLTGKDLTLLADIPEYFPTRNLPADYRYIGPLTWKSTFPLPPWWPPPQGCNPLVYITMGTTGVSDFFAKVYDLIKTSELSAIITMGGQSEGQDTIAGKLYVADFIDGDLAMEASDLVVCHGGNGTIYQALQHGRPIIGIPTIPDQQFNMRRVEALGLGKMISWKDFLKRPALLMEVIRSVLTDKSFSERAAEFKHKLSAYDAPRTAADILEECFSPSGCQYKWQY